MRLFNQPADRIWKFEIPYQDEFILTMPAGAIPLSVGIQNSLPVLWAAVDGKTEEREEHRFFLLGTDHPLPNLLLSQFIGTFQLQELGLVFHLFDGGPIAEDPPALMTEGAKSDHLKSDG